MMEELLLGDQPPPTSKPLKPVLVAILDVAWPSCVQNAVCTSSWLLTFVLLGHYTDETVLAGYTLSNVFCNMLGRFFMWGLAAGFDTLASQAWGAKEYRKLGLFAQRALLLLLLCVCLPLSLAWIFASPILEAIGQPRDVARQASIFAQISLPRLYFDTATCILQKAFFAMGKPRPVMIVSVLTEGVTIGLLVLFIAAPWFHLGLCGAALAFLISSAFSCLATVGLALRDPDFSRCWPGFTWESFRNWGGYLRLGAPACLMLLAEALSWDAVTLLAGFCNTATGAHRASPTDILAAQGLLTGTIAFTYCVPMAIGKGISTVVGNAVGMGDKMRAARASRFGLEVGLIAVASLVGTLVFLRVQVVELYAAPAAVAKIVVDLLPCVAAFLFADGMQMCLSGTITGAGKQGVTMPILVVSYWVLGLPLGALFALRWPELGLLGLWIGMTLAVYVHFGSYLLLCFCPCVPHAVRWEAVLEEARQRLAKEEGEGVSRTEQDQEREVPLWEKCDAVI
mmetsp:Transcript_50334/g.68458  ORF Transcript_50334/g.68458 Transcript_50334/m.68458 type:complete len:511 (-) Transcript_50334:83-1615(-)